MDDLARFCCPNTQCSEFGRRHAGNLSVHDRFGKHRQHRLLCCHVCQHSFSENKGTVFFRAKLPHETIVAILRHLQEGCGIRATHAWSGSIATPSSAWPAWPAITPTTFMTSSWLFPPATREVQFDEKWAFVGKKQKNCDPNNPDDAQCGDYWDFVAFDPEHRLVLAVVPGARTAENAEAIVEEVKQRLGGTAPALMTSDELPAYATAIETTFSEPVSPPARRGPGRPRIVPERSLPEGLCYATVHKERENGRVVAVEQEQVFGTAEALDEALSESSASQSVNTSFVERHHGTDRSRNARKSRKTYQFSKDWEIHEAMTYFTMYSYNFCWEVRTLRVRREEGGWQPRTPAMAAGLSDHVWSLEEWLAFPAFQST